MRDAPLFGRGGATKGSCFSYRRGSAARSVAASTAVADVPPLRMQSGTPIRRRRFRSDTDRATPALSVGYERFARRGRRRIGPSSGAQRATRVKSGVARHPEQRLKVALGSVHSTSASSKSSNAALSAPPAKQRRTTNPSSTRFGNFAPTKVQATIDLRSLLGPGCRSQRDAGRRSAHAVAEGDGHRGAVIDAREQRGQFCVDRAEQRAGLPRRRGEDHGRSLQRFARDADAIAIPNEFNRFRLRPADFDGPADAPLQLVR